MALKTWHNHSYGTKEEVASTNLLIIAYLCHEDNLIFNVSACALKSEYNSFKKCILADIGRISSLVSFV